MAEEMLFPATMIDTDWLNDLCRAIEDRAAHRWQRARYEGARVRRKILQDRDECV